MAVAFDAKATAVTTTASATSGTNATLTVGASATLLIGILTTQSVTTAPNMNWDSTASNVAMTLVASQSNSVGNAYIFALVSPVTGNKTMHAGWTTASIADIECLSFTGSSTVLASAIMRSNTSAPTGTTTTLVLSGSTNNISLCLATNNHNSFTSLTATGSTNIFAQSTVASIASYAPSLASLTWSALVTGTGVVNMIGCDICVPPVALTDFSNSMQTPLLTQ